MNHNNPTELRQAAESNRRHANYCLSIERPVYLAMADAQDARADNLEREQSMKTVHITNFVRRQTPESGFSHWTLSDEDLVNQVQIGLRYAKQGYREGVILVPVHSQGFFSSTCLLKDGDKLVGEYKPRQKGEDPRKSSYVLNGQKQPAKSVAVILYSHAVLLESKENESEADYEIVSVNASVTEQDEPIPTGALIANHLGLSGGTATKMTDEEFVKALRVSVEFWKDKARAAPQELIDALVPEFVKLSLQG